MKLFVKIIRQQFPSAHMFILFGSCARGSWGEETYTEGHISYEYISDFDILALTGLKKTAENHSKLRFFWSLPATREKGITLKNLAADLTDFLLTMN